MDIKAGLLNSLLKKLAQLACPQHTPFSDLPIRDDISEKFGCLGLYKHSVFCSFAICNRYFAKIGLKIFDT